MSGKGIHALEGPKGRDGKPMVADTAGGERFESPVRRFVSQLLEWDAAVAKLERVARGDASPIAGMLRDCEIYSGSVLEEWQDKITGNVERTTEKIEGGLIGSGCWGTKGVGRAPAPEPEAIYVDADAHGRYLALRGTELRTVFAILAEGQGFSLVTRAFDRNTYSLTLPVRIAMELISGDRARKWQGKLIRGDATPVLKEGEREGGRLLKLASKAWWEAL